MKKRFKELQKELKLKDDEIDILKRQTKATRFTEMQVENRALLEELTRMKNLYEAALQMNTSQEYDSI